MPAYKAKAPPVLHVQGFDGNAWDEWNRLVNLPGTFVRHIPGKNTFDVTLTNRGREVASRSETMTAREMCRQAIVGMTEG